MYQKTDLGFFQKKTTQKISATTLESNLKEKSNSTISFSKTETIIGEGAFGTVFVGSYNDMKVAIKVIKFGEGSPTSFKDCEDEKNILQHLTEQNADNVVRLYSYDIQVPHYSLILEYLGDYTLDHYIEHHVPFEWSQRYEIIRDISSAVKSIHFHGYIHGDIKPGNIVITENSRAKLCDFGKSKEEGDTTSNKMGTLEYMPPELMNSSFTKKGDIFSLGKVFWELASWKFHNKKRDENDGFFIWRGTINGSRLPIPEGCPRKIGKIISWCVEQEPSKRPDAEELSSELKSDIDTLSTTLSM